MSDAATVTSQAMRERGTPRSVADGPANRLRRPENARQPLCVSDESASKPRKQGVESGDQPPFRRAAVLRWPPFPETGEDPFR